MSLISRVFLGVVSGLFCILLAWNAAPVAAEATDSSVYRCLQVHIGMTRHDAEHIMGVPLFSAPMISYSAMRVVQSIYQKRTECTRYSLTSNYHEAFHYKRDTPQ